MFQIFATNHVSAILVHTVAAPTPNAPRSALLRGCCCRDSPYWQRRHPPPTPATVRLLGLCWLLVSLFSIMRHGWLLQLLLLLLLGHGDAGRHAGCWFYYYPL
jgi:hypothetical protein